MQAGNRAIKDGTMQKALQQAHETLKPEASYFLPEGGQRTAYFFCDLPDESQIVSRLEPFFLNLEAEVDVLPVMNLDDLLAGLERTATS